MARKDSFSDEMESERRKMENYLLDRLLSDIVHRNPLVFGADSEEDFLGAFSLTTLCAVAKESLICRQGTSERAEPIPGPQLGRVEMSRIVGMNLNSDYELVRKNYWIAV